MESKMITLCNVLSQQHIIYGVFTIFTISLHDISIKQVLVENDKLISNEWDSNTYYIAETEVTKMHF